MQLLGRIPFIYQLDLEPRGSLLLIILSSVVINPVFEESILIGYLGKWFEKSSPVLFLMVSIVLRLSYHTYQNIWGITGAMVMGLVFSIYYIKFKKLTPTIIAHMLYNLTFYI